MRASCDQVWVAYVVVNFGCSNWWTPCAELDIELMIHAFLVWEVCDGTENVPDFFVRIWPYCDNHVGSHP